MLDAARSEGFDGFHDQCPYKRAMTSIQSLILPWALASGRLKTVQRIEQIDIRKKICKKTCNDIETGLPG